MRAFHVPESRALLGKPAFEFIAVQIENINNIVYVVKKVIKLFFIGSIFWDAMRIREPGDRHVRLKYRGINGDVFRLPAYMVVAVALIKPVILWEPLPGGRPFKNHRACKLEEFTGKRALLYQ